MPFFVSDVGINVFKEYVMKPHMNANVIWVGLVIIVL